MASKKDMTRAQIENCKKLAVYLENLPTTYKHFNMGAWFHGDDVSMEEEFDYAKNNGGVDQFPCGTVACAVGHGPSAGVYGRVGKDIFVQRNHWGESFSVDWDAYANRFVPDGDLMNWCFGGTWEEYDNTHRGAAARLRFILDGNEVPEDYDRWGDDWSEYRRWVEAYAPYLVVGDDHIEPKAAMLLEGA